MWDGDLSESGSQPLEEATEPLPHSCLYLQELRRGREVREVQEVLGVPAEECSHKKGWERQEEAEAETTTVSNHVQGGEGCFSPTTRHRAARTRPPRETPPPPLLPAPRRAHAIPCLVEPGFTRNSARLRGTGNSVLPLSHRKASAAVSLPRAPRPAATPGSGQDVCTAPGHVTDSLSASLTLRRGAGTARTSPDKARQEPAEPGGPPAAWTMGCYGF